MLRCVPHRQLPGAGARHHRRGRRPLVSRLLDQPEGGLTYALAGVSIKAGDEFVQRIKDVVASTARPEVLGGIGGFGGLFHLNSGRYHDPVIVSSADGGGWDLPGWRCWRPTWSAPARSRSSCSTTSRSANSIPSD